MPPGLSLEEIARDYPNHIIGSGIRPFMLAGWSAKKIWDALRPSAQVSTSAGRGWNKFEHRAITEKRRMEAEEKDRQGTQGVIPTASTNVGGSTRPSNAGVGDQLLEVGTTRAQRSNAPSSMTNLSAAPQTHSAPSRETAASDVPDHIVARKKAINELFTAESSRQASLLYALRNRDDPKWPSKYQAERLRNTEVDWVRHAQLFERRFVANHGLTVDGLENEQTSRKGMLRRLRALLLQRSHIQLTLLVAGREGVENVPSIYETELATLEETLEIVQSWTSRWHEQLHGPMQQNPEAIHNQLPISSSPAADRREVYTSEQTGGVLGVLDPRLQNPSTDSSGVTVQERMRPVYQDFLAQQSQTGNQDRHPTGPRKVQQGRRETGDQQLRFQDVPARSHTAYGSSHPQTSTLPSAHTSQRNLRRQASTMPSNTSENTAASTAISAAAEQDETFSSEDYLRDPMLPKPD